MKRFAKFFTSLRWKLISTYTLVTALALLALEVVLISLIMGIYVFTDAYESAYLDDVRYIHYPEAANYLEKTPPDMEGLINWANELKESGFASLPPQEFMDSPAARIVENTPIVLLDPQGSVLHITGDALDVQQQEQFLEIDQVKQIIVETNMNPREVFYKDSINYKVALENETILLVIPIMSSSEELIGFMLLNIENPPPAILNISRIIIISVAVTAVILILIIAPFGALFGFIFSRNLTKRVRYLSAIVNQWTKDDFGLMPMDKSKDELGELAQDLSTMAEEFQLMLKTEQELSVVEERNRIARELHDTVKQQVFATMMQVRAAKNWISTDGEKAKEHLDQAEAFIKSSQKDLVLMINELKPISIFEDTNFSGAVQEYLLQWQAQTDIKTNFIKEGVEPESLTFSIGHNLYRVIQEALANINKHSHARTATIRFDFKGAESSIMIIDDGVGFDTKYINPSGFGLNSMKQRVEAIGGTLTIHSLPNKGTTLAIRIKDIEHG